MSQGTAINNAGQVVGYSNLNGQQFTGPYHASIWTPSMGAQDLGTLGGPSATSIAYAINDPGQVVGSSTLAAGTLATGPAHAFLASPVTITLSGGQGMGWSMQDLGTLGGTNSYATAINNSGQIVGFSLLAGSTVSHAFIYQGGVMTDLNSLLGTAYTGWVLESANAINNYGQIVGTGTYCSPTVGSPSGSNTNCVSAAFRLDPAGEGAPSSGANCNGSYSATFAGDLKVSNGQICNFLGGLILGNIQLNGGSLSLKNTLLIGNVALQNGYATFYDDTLVGYVNMEGGSLNLIGSAFGGGMNIAGGYFSIDPSTILGNLEIRNLPTGTAISQICGLTLYGNLQIAGNAAPILVGQGGACGGNSIYGNTQIQNNAAAVTVIGNTVSGNLQVQNNSAPVSVIDNTVSRNLQCSGNTAITGNGNKVSGNKQGQCAAF
jgi:probable HAF family extracellular repeat protein